jgi:cytochrome bd-type quinol oxidase subunit 1
MRALLGGDSFPFLGMTVLFGLAAVLTGRAMAETWRQPWQVMPTGLALAAAERFLLYALFGSKLWSLGGYLAASVLLLAAIAGSYYGARARKMVRQYPWLYERSGPFGWRPKQPEAPN